MEMSLKPLDPHVRPGDPIVLNLLGQVAGAADKVRNRYRRNTGVSGERLTAMSETQAEA